MIMIATTITADAAINMSWRPELRDKSQIVCLAVSSYIAAKIFSQPKVTKAKNKSIVVQSKFADISSSLFNAILI